MDHYIRVDGEGKGLGVWEVTQDEAIRIGITNARNGPGCFFQAEPGEDIFDAIRRQAAGWFGPNGESAFHKLELPPGSYYPRMARPNDQHPHESPGHYPVLFKERNTHAMSRTQASVLLRMLNRIFETIHPAPENLRVYGHDTRNLLILAATEVEAQWRGILVANGVLQDRYSTNDYVRLLKPMRLDSYAIGLAEYPWLEPAIPFGKWFPPKPTMSLDWYDAYNATKHNREDAFSRATLEHAIAAVSAVVAILVAQYGVPYGLGQGSDLAEHFQVIACPAWEPGEVYTFNYAQHHKWTPVHYPL